MNIRRISALKRLPLLVGAMMMVLAGASWSWAQPDNWDQQAAKRKATYTLLQSRNEYNADKIDDYVLLVLRAYDLDSADLDVAAEWGTVTMALGGADSATTEKAYEAVRRRFLTDPTDYLTGIRLASRARALKKYPDMVRTWEILDSVNPQLTQPAEELADAYLISYIVGDSAAYDKALAIYDRLESGTGKDINHSAMKIRAYSIKGDTTAIVNEIDALLQHAPDDPTVSIFAGSNYQYLHDYDKALQYYSRACELDSTLGIAYMSKAMIYEELGDSAAYDREVFSAMRSPNIELEQKLGILHDYVVKLYADSTQQPRIRQLFDQLEQMHAGEAQIHILYSIYLYNIKDYDGAIEQILYAIDLDPTDQDSWEQYLMVLGIAEKPQEIVNVAPQALERFPQSISLYYSTATAYQTLGDNKRAVEVLDSVQLGPDVDRTLASNILAYKGDLIAFGGDTIAALRAYDEALDYNPDNFMALNNAAYFMSERDLNLDKAERYISRVIRNIPDNPTYLDTYAWVLFKQKSYTLAKHYIDMTINIYTEEAQGEDADSQDSKISADIYEHAGDIYYMCDEPDKALEFWQKALEIEPENEALQRKVEQQKP